MGALLFLGLSLFYGWQIPDIPQLPVDEFEAMNARSMPWALTFAGVVLSLALFMVGGAGPAALTQVATEQDSPRGDQLKHISTAIALLIWTAFYANLLDWLGFFAATTLFLLGGFGLLGERRVTVLFAVALTTAALMYLLLRFGLGLYLPDGLLWLQISGAVHV